MNKKTQVETLAMLMYQNSRRYPRAWNGPFTGERTRRFWRARAERLLKGIHIRGIIIHGGDQP